MCPALGITTKSAPGIAAANKFGEFVLRMQGQKVMIDPANGGGDSYVNPVITGMTPNAARQQSGINWVTLNTIQAADQINSIKTWFHNNIVE